MTMMSTTVHRSGRRRAHQAAATAAAYRATLTAADDADTRCPSRKCIRDARTNRRTVRRILRGTNLTGDLA